MNYDGVFRKCQEQYETMYKWMRGIDINMDVLRANNSSNTMKVDKILKRIARMEDKLKIIRIEGD